MHHTLTEQMTVVLRTSDWPVVLRGIPAVGHRHTQVVVDQGVGHHHRPAELVVHRMVGQAVLRRLVGRVVVPRTLVVVPHILAAVLRNLVVVLLGIPAEVHHSLAGEVLRLPDIK